MAKELKTTCKINILSWFKKKRLKTRAPSVTRVVVGYLIAATETPNRESAD